MTVCKRAEVAKKRLYCIPTACSTLPLSVSTDLSKSLEWSKWWLFIANRNHIQIEGEERQYRTSSLFWYQCNLRER